MGIFYIIISLFKRNNISTKKIIHKNIINIILIKIFFFISRKNKKRKKGCKDNDIRPKLMGGAWGQKRGSSEVAEVTNNRKNWTKYWEGDSNNKKYKNLIFIIIKTIWI